MQGREEPGFGTDSSFEGTVDWLNENSASIQALAGAASLIVTLVLAVLTGKYVLLTKSIAGAAERQLTHLEAGRANYARGLAALAGELSAMVGQLSSSRSEHRAIVEGELPAEDEVRQVERLALYVSGGAAEQAVYAARELRRLRVLSDKERARREKHAGSPSEVELEEWRDTLELAREFLQELEVECRKVE